MLFWELLDQCKKDSYLFRKLVSDEFGQLIIISRNTEIIQQEKNIVGGAKKSKASCISLEKCSCSNEVGF